MRNRPTLRITNCELYQYNHFNQLPRQESEICPFCRLSYRGVPLEKVGKVFLSFLLVPFEVVAQNDNA